MPAGRIAPLPQHPLAVDSCSRPACLRLPPTADAAERDASAAWEADVSSRIQWAMAKGVEMGALRSGDKIVAVHGWKSGDSSTNTVRSLVVP